MPPSEHSMQVQEWKLNEYISRMYDIIDMSNTEAHPNQNDCRPTVHGSDLDGLFPT